MIKRWHLNPIDDAHRAGAEVIVAGTLEAEMRGGEVFVELPNRPHVFEPLEWKTIRMRRGLPAHSGLEQADEVPLIDEVLPPLERAARTQPVP